MFKKRLALACLLLVVLLGGAWYLLTRAILLKSYSNQEGLLAFSGAMTNTLLHQKAISWAIGWEAKTRYLAFQSGDEVRQANSWCNMGSCFFQASLYDATPNGNLLITPNPRVNMIWATTFLEMALQKATCWAKPGALKFGSMCWARHVYLRKHYSGDL